MEKQKVFSVKEFAAALGVTRKRIMKAIRLKQINAIALGERYIIPATELQRITGLE